MRLRLRGLRQQKGLSIRGLAAKAEVDFSTVYRIEAGKVTPDLATVEKLAKALGVKVADLLARDFKVMVSEWLERGGSVMEESSPYLRDLPTCQRCGAAARAELVNARNASQGGVYCRRCGMRALKEAEEKQGRGHSPMR